MQLEITWNYDFKLPKKYHWKSAGKYDFNAGNILKSFKILNIFNLRNLEGVPLAGTVPGLGLRPENTNHDENRDLYHDHYHGQHDDHHPHDDGDHLAGHSGDYLDVRLGRCARAGPRT